MTHAQEITDLALNAREAMTEGGKLTIETSNAAQDASSEPRILLSVTDGGPGSDEEAMAHLYEPFFTTKAAAGGTGLGLAIVGDIVGRCGGSIVVHSRPGQGTSFQISLPRTMNAEREA